MYIRYIILSCHELCVLSWSKEVIFVAMTIDWCCASSSIETSESPHLDCQQCAKMVLFACRNRITRQNRNRILSLLHGNHLPPLRTFVNAYTSTQCRFINESICRYCLHQAWLLPGFCKSNHQILVYSVS